MIGCSNRIAGFFMNNGGVGVVFKNDVIDFYQRCEE